MNLELLEEIHSLLDDGNSISDVAMSLGMQKNILLVCLRMEKLISDEYENVIKNVIDEKSSLIDDLKFLENEKNILIEEVESLKLLNETKLLQENYKLQDENCELQDEIVGLENFVKILQNKNIELEKKYKTIPYFIKRWFE